MKKNEIDLYIEVLFKGLNDKDETGTSALEELYTMNGDTPTFCSIEEFAKNLEEEIRLKSEENQLDYDSPVITEEQLYDCYSAVYYQLVLDNMVDEGLLVKNFNIDKGENTYKINDKNS